MSPHSDLDAVIRVVDGETPVDPSCQVLVAIDTRTGQPARTGLWASLARKHQKHFLVTNSRRAGAVAVRRNLKIGIEDFSHDWRFDLVLDYEVRCNPGREIRAVQALWRGGSPQERLEALLKGWVLQKLEGRAADFVRDFDRAAESLGQDLRACALEQAGLTLAVRVLLADADRLDSLCIGPCPLPVRVRDRDDELDLRFEAELAVEAGREQVAFLHRDRLDFLEREVRRKAREFFALHVTLQQFHAELENRVKSDLWRSLDDVVEPYGRKLVRLSMAGEAYPRVVETKRIEHRFSHRLRDYPEPVEVRTELLLQLADLGRYVRAKAPDLEVWADQEVETAAIQCLFGVTYTELCLQYDEKKLEIERWMKDRAAAIGYELKQLITITNLQFDALRRPFLVQLDGEFPTRLAKLKVRLQVNATLVVPDPRQIAPLLNRRINVKEQIRNTLNDRIQQKLHQVDPERFYMEFETSKLESVPVRAQIEEVIVETVRSEFQAEVLSLSCVQLETELSQRLERLMAPLHHFSVRVEASRGGPPVLFDGSFRVTGVDESGWIAFQTSNPEPEDLRACAERHLRFLLADEQLAPLLQTLNAEQKDRVNLALQKRIQQEYGLRILVMDWLRHALDEEKEVAKTQLALVTDTVKEQQMRIELAEQMRQRDREMQLESAGSRLEQLKKLQARLARLLEAGGPPQQEADLREKIARLQEEQKGVSKEATTDRSRAILPHLRSARAILGATTEEPPRKSSAAPEAEPTARDDSAGQQSRPSS